MTLFSVCGISYTTVEKLKALLYFILLTCALICNVCICYFITNCLLICKLNSKPTCAVCKQQKHPIVKTQIHLGDII